MRYADLHAENTWLRLVPGARGLHVARLTICSADIAGEAKSDHLRHS